MVPLLAAEPGKVPWRESFLYQNYEDPAYPKVTFDLFAVRTPTHKYVEMPQHPDWNQLFDLEKDPKEMNNLIADPRHGDLLAKMQGEMRELKSGAGLDTP
jgi:hypothetical protein